MLLEAEGLGQGLVVSAPLPVEAPEVPRRGSHGWWVLAMHSIILVPKELLPWGLVALGDGGDVELLVGDFFEGARVPCAEDGQCELLGLRQARQGSGTAQPLHGHRRPVTGAGMHVYNISIYRDTCISGEELGRPLSKQQIIASSPMLLRSQRCWVQVQGSIGLPGARALGFRTLLMCKTFSDFLGTSGGPPWGDAATWSSE